jgi:ketosteroid isomerase-like protein
MRKTILAVALVFFSAAPALAQDADGAMADAEASPLQALFDGFTVAYNAGDAHAVAALYTEEAATMYANQVRMEGPMAIAGQFEDAFAAGAQIVLHPGDSMIMDEMATDHGHYVLTMEVDGETVTQSGYWMGVYKMVDGDWKVVRGISNNDTEM